MIIVLEKLYENGKYKGMIVVDTQDLTLEFIEELRRDKSDKKGWRKYQATLKDKGYDIEQY